jgi:MFS family permease
MVGGVLLSAFTAHAPIVLPLVGARAPWQATLIAAGLPGVLLTLLVATLREPARPGQSGATPAANFDFVGYLRANWLVFSLMLTAFGCHFLLTYGVSSWYPVLLMRGAHLSPASTGLIMGSFQLLGAFIAATCGGWLSDVFAKRDPAGGRLRLVRYALLSQFLILLPLLFPHSLLGLVAAFFFYEPVVIFCSSVVYALLPDFVPATGRGRMLALEQLISSLVGLGLGPTLVATMTDKVFGDESLVNLSMLAVALAAAGLGAAAATLALPAARKLHARLAEGR